MRLQRDTLPCQHAREDTHAPRVHKHPQHQRVRRLQRDVQRQDLVLVRVRVRRRHR